MRSGRLTTPLAVMAVVLAGCGGMEPLQSKTASVPAGIDLSGQWRLIGDATADTRQPMADDVRVDVFLRSGESLKVTQTDHALFVSFDRSVVEEYRFGENRVVNVGAVEAERVSGWENGAYAIVTRDGEGAMLTETYSLSSDGRQMTRAVRITYRNRMEFELRQVFERS